MSDNKDTALNISDEIKKKVGEWGFTEGDLKKCIQTAEETGLKLRSEDGNLFLTKLKIAETFVCAVYERDGDSFKVNDAYSHKTIVTGW